VLPPQHQRLASERIAQVLCRHSHLDKGDAATRCCHFRQLLVPASASSTDRHLWLQKIPAYWQARPIAPTGQSARPRRSGR